MKLEEEVELMDIKAEMLYGELIELLGGNVDHAEVDYITKLVRRIIYKFYRTNIQLWQDHSVGYSIYLLLTILEVVKLS